MGSKNGPPSMLTLAGLLAPVQRAESRIKDIWLAATRTDGSVIVDHGLFVLMISSFEVMLADCLKYYLIQRPDKLDFKDDKFTTELLLASPFTRDFVPAKVEKKVRAVGFGSLKKALNYVLNTLEINEPPFVEAVEEPVERVIEAKETRNLLLHNDLIINDDYRNRAGQYARTGERGPAWPDDPKRLAIPSEYMVATYGHIENVIREFKNRLCQRYENCTRLAFFRQLWDYIIANPEFARFDDFWQVNAERDCITGILIWKAECQLGGAEKMLLGFWRVNVTGKAEHQQAIVVRSMDKESRRMLNYLERVANEFGLY
jgi:hypothetical protein